MIEILLGILLPVLLVCTGIFFFIYLRGYPLRAPRRLHTALFGASATQRRAARQALFTALAGTLGVGNISGVAAAVTLGGAGALFWMWVCGIVAMIIKYAEIALALSQKKNGHGGAMYYIGCKPLAVLFALLCLACGFAMGNMTQVCAAGEAVAAVLPRAKHAVGTVFALTLPFILLKGKRGVFRFAERVVPIMTLSYCLLATAFLFQNSERIPSAFAAVFRSAFSLRALGGGAMGSGILLGLRYGASRGMISNEAGCGTAPIAHAASDSEPAAQGCLGIAEVFIDTILLCTLTGLCVLVCPEVSAPQGTLLILRVFATKFGAVSGYLLSFAMVIFAFATVICWFYYCAECLCYLTKGARFEKPLAILFSFLCAIAPLFREESLFIAADLLICLMAFLNLPALLCRRAVIRQCTLSYFQKKNK